MAGKGRPGVEPMVGARARFLALVETGVSSSAAAREVGVHRRTGTRWLYGRTVTTRNGGLLHYAAFHNRGCSWGLKPPVSSRLRAM